MNGLLIENIGSLVTLQSLAKEKRGSHVQEKDLGIIRDAWLFCEGTKVHSFGQASPPRELVQKATQRHDAQKGLVIPGLVDSHTHTLFGGSRHHEFAQRLNGLSYQKIAEAGGGIRSTLKATRATTDEELIKKTLSHCQKFLRRGVTTVEIKTGYGLSVTEELRLSRLLKRIQAQCPSHLVLTCLALHDFSPEHAQPEDYVRELIDKLLPVLVKEKLADFVDAFVESGYYTAAQVEPFMMAAKNAGLGIRLHADEFSASQGAQSAARWGAASADHLQQAGEAGAKALAAAGTVATLLPGTSLYTGIAFTDARPFLNAGCAVGIASDFNPGSSYFDNLPQLAALGAVHCKLKSWQAIAAVTYVPALSLNLGSSKGALAEGFDADFSVHAMSDVEEWLADMGQTAPREVWLGAEKQMF